MACAGCSTPKPTLIHETETIEVAVIEFAAPPPGLMMACPVSSLPHHGTTWLELPGYVRRKHLEQLQCNEQLRVLRDWADQVATEPE